MDRHFIEFTKETGKKMVIELSEIHRVEEDDNGAYVDGDKVKESYDSILECITDYANVMVDHDLTKGDYNEESIKSTS